MKKTAIILPALLALWLTACSGTSNATTGENMFQGTPGNEPLSIPMQLLIGTLKLDGTPNAVTKDQANTLLPLWQVYQQLSSSDTAAQEELDALVEQIQETMTPDQVQAISDMKLTRESMFTVMQELGVNFGRGPVTGNGTFSPRENDGGGFPGGGPGGFPGGGPEGEPGGAPGGQNFSPQQMETAQAQRSQGGSGGGFNMNRIPSGMFDALIQYLDNVAGKFTATPQVPPSPQGTPPASPSQFTPTPTP